MIGRANRLLPFAVVTCGWLALLVATDARGPEGQRAGQPKRHADLSLFAHSDDCVACHNNLQTASGEDVSIGSMWRSTLMANSARDPYWQAAVRRETLDHPTHASDIQDDCASCHMPMAQRIARAAGGKGQVFPHLSGGDKSTADLDRLAADSVSCAVCHQIAPDALGTKDSFNGRFVLKPTPSDGARIIYGPYAIDGGRRTIMRSVSGFVQEETAHLKQSELCASCHTLITTAFGPSGAVVGSLPEQMNYQEWRHSDFSRGAEARSCQSCHMPAAPGPIRIASVLGDVRDSLARHVFVGGNAHMLRILTRYRTELGVPALPGELERTAQATVRQLQQDTATLSIGVPRLEDNAVSFAVTVQNLTGHKFPTGYPSRRTWLHITVRDGQGRTVFESGAVDPDGRIRGNDGDQDSARFEPHFDLITSASEVQVYEAILGDATGAPTTGLLSAVRYLKDNRLLPRGFDKGTAAAEIGVQGDALDDGDFAGGGDRVRYRVAVASAGPFTIDAELVYQSIAYRWAHNLGTYNALETKRFVSYYQATSSGSSIITARGAVRTQTTSQ